MSIALSTSTAVFTGLIGTITLLAALCIGLCFYARKQLRKVSEQSLAQVSIPTQLAEIANHLEHFQSRVDELESRRPVETPRRSPTPAKNNRRRDVAKLYQSGESLVGIASALGVSQGEVKLTLKLQEMFGEGFQEKN
jgi:DNA-binding NarL/FixJ family response regulator